MLCVCYRLALPYASGSVFAGFELGSVRLWSEEFGFSIRIDPMHNIELTLAKSHANNTCGLCGNYNSMPGDDYTAQEGKFLWEMGGDRSCKRDQTMGNYSAPYQKFSLFAFVHYICWLIYRFIVLWEKKLGLCDGISDWVCWWSITVKTTEIIVSEAFPQETLAHCNSLEAMFLVCKIK